MGKPVRLTATPEEIAVILNLARSSDGFEAASEPSALDSSRALNAGLTPDDVKNALEIITLIFTTGDACLGFLKEVRDYVQPRGSAVSVSDPMQGKSLGRIEARTTDEDINRFFPP